MTAINPQDHRDQEDGRALRELLESMPDGVWVSVSRSPDGAGRLRVKTPSAWMARASIAEAADACRDADR
jgi:hypothetical protein